MKQHKCAHPGSTLISISHCIYHTFLLSVGTLPPSKAHTSPEPCVHSDHYCVVALRIKAPTNVHALREQVQSDMQWYPGLYKLIQLCSILVLDREMLTFSHPAMRKWASPSLSLVALWIVRDVSGSSKKYLETHSNERSKQAYWSYEITIFFLRKDTDIGIKIQKLFWIKI